MGARKQRSHEITIRVTVNKPILRKDAIYAAWNALDGYKMYGGEDDQEPWSTGKIKVLRKR